MLSEERSSTQSIRASKKKFIDVYLLGLAMKLGGCVAAWHNGFVTGFWPYLICVCIIAIGYFCLTLCISEMMSAVAFPGGYYGYVRCGIGPLSGFLVGCSGLIEAIFFLAASVLKISQAFTFIFALSDEYMPIFWFITYAIVLSIHIRGGSVFWSLMKLCTVISLVFLLIYLFGSMPNLDMKKWAYGSAGYDADTLGGLTDLDLPLFFQVLRLPSWMFLGVDLLSLACDEVEDPKAAVPNAILSVMGTIAVLAVWLTFTVGCQAPGLFLEFSDDDITNVFPLSIGYHNALGISLRGATAFIVFPLFGACTGYMFAVGRQINSMAKSGLFPPLLKMTYGTEQTPIAAMVFGTILGLASLFGVRNYDQYPMLLRLAVLGGCPVYLAMFACFLVFRSRYRHMKRGFVNPFGKFSAVLGSVIFLLLLATLIKYQTGTKVMTAYFAFMGVMILYYYFYAEKRQFFSDEEQSIFLKAYVVNFNMRKNTAIQYRFAADCRAIIFDTINFCLVSDSNRSQSSAGKVASEQSLHDQRIVEEAVTTLEPNQETTLQQENCKEDDEEEEGDDEGEGDDNFDQYQQKKNMKSKMLNLHIVNNSQYILTEQHSTSQDGKSENKDMQQDEIYAKDEHNEEFHLASRRRFFDLLQGTERTNVGNIVIVGDDSNDDDEEDDDYDDEEEERRRGIRPECIANDETNISAITMTVFGQLPAIHEQEEEEEELLLLSPLR